jgi:glucuronyl/N-acetylglucosaminyl transferase EXT1
VCRARGVRGRLRTGSRYNLPTRLFFRSIMPRPEQVFGLRLYCLTVQCRTVLEDLDTAAGALQENLHEHRAAIPAAVALGLLSCMALALALFGSSSGRTWRIRTAAAVVSVLLLSFAAFSSLHSVVAEQQELMATWLHSHGCIDHARCARGFSVHLEVGKDFNLSSALAWPVPPVWVPPPSVQLAASAETACLIIQPIGSNTDTGTNLPQLASPCACSSRPCKCRPSGGRNVVIVARGDAGVSWRWRLGKLGCAMVAQSHMEQSRFVPGFDISIPLSLVPGRNGAPSLEMLESIAPKLKRHHSRPSPRAFWLSFRGSINYGAGRERRSLLLPLANRSTAKRPIEISCTCAKGADGRYSGRDLSASSCDELASARKKAPSYLTTLNATFALVPGGMQPASFRLDEVMAAGAIPVFVAGDLDNSSPYVRPFADTIPWSTISLHFAWEHIGDIVDSLNRIPDDEIARMQRGVQHAWQKFLRPPLAHRQTFYGLLQERVRYQAR